MGYLEDRLGLGGRVAVVTGGAAGLGLAIVRELARAGAHVAICDRDEVALTAAKRELLELPVRSLAVLADVMHPDALESFFAQVSRSFDRLDILANVPGGVARVPFLETTADEWARDLEWNLMHVVRASQYAARQMHHFGNGGSIINVTTIEGHRAAPGFAVYSAAKAGVANFTRTLATELGPYGIRVNAIAPDQTPTPGLQANVTPASAFNLPEGTDVEALRERSAEISMPLGRLGRLEDIGGCALFLASDLAGYITGQTLHADGGAFAASGWMNLPGVGWRVRVPLNWIQDPA